ncbi:oligoendopeptidase, M3 family [Ruminococcaceae bacterium KH2T8]|nr:oligoendopeptidase, M3 family [Ruminococcaceae bacterium KH2T8]
MADPFEGQMPDFKDIKYVRPDIEAFTSFVKEVRLKLMTCQDADIASEIILDYEKKVSGFDTQYALCNILHDLDTSDDFYTDELEFFDEAFATVSELTAAVLTSLLNCPCADALRAKYGDMIFRKAVNQKETVSKEIIDELVKESSLENDYGQIQSEAQIEFGGEILNLSTLAPYLESTDRKTRRKAHIALDKYYQGKKETFDKIYDDMVKVRTEAARKLGYKSFTELGYKRMERYDYTRDDVAKFRDDIVKYIVPITEQIRKLQKERLGVDELMYWDLPTLFKNGNPVPNVSGEGYERVAGNFFRDIFGVVPSFFDVLSEHGFTDLLARNNKSTGGYCMYLEDYAIPYIFMNGNGTADDVATLVHEGGHAYAAIRSAEVSPFVECLSPTLETCEIHSTAMEFMSYPYMNMFYGDKAEQYCELHMTQALLFLPYGCMVDEYQHIVYDDPDMKPEQRHQVWKDLEKKYQPFNNYGDQMPFHEMGGAWMKKDHIFTTPFYYIDYCLAHICALQLWDESRTDMKTALSKYNQLCEAGGTDTFLNLIGKAGLESPFDTGVIKKLAYSICKFLEL